MPDASGKPASTTTGGDVSAIEAVIRTYFDGLYEGDVEKLGAAFHPVSHLYSERDGEVVDLPRERWFEMVRNRASPAASGLARDDRILMLDISGPETAFVKVACQIPPRYFTDYLVLNRTKAGWKIVSKVFRADVRD